jgi:PAS domain S-box-containing protein
LKELPKVYFERLLESSPDIVVAVDRRGRVIFYNDGAEETLGYEAEEILGTPVDVLYPSPAEARRVMAAMRAAEVDGEGHVKNFETEFVRRNKETVPVAISGTIIFDAAGREQGSIGFAKDISGLRQHEKFVTLGQLAVGLAHEINNPLEILVNQVEMLERYLRQKANPEDYTREHERIDAVKRELRRIQAIVERVGEMAAEGAYASREYLPGQLMTDLAVADVEEAPVRRGVTTNGSEHAIGGRNVMVVDDDTSICSSMADILGCEGCNVVTTTSGHDALRYIETHPVDLVISDVQMPDMDGYELFSRIQSCHADLPVVLMTAYYYDKDHVIKRSKAAGLTDVIFKKPIDPDRLLELVDARVGG